MPFVKSLSHRILNWRPVNLIISNSYLVAKGRLSVGGPLNFHINYMTNQIYDRVDPNN